MNIENKRNNPCPPHDFSPGGFWRQPRCSKCGAYICSHDRIVEVGTEAEPGQCKCGAENWDT